MERAGIIFGLDLQSGRKVPKKQDYGIHVFFLGFFYPALPIPVDGCQRLVNYVDNRHELGMIRCMSENTEILGEIRDLLILIAEPALAKRDERRRAALQQVVGKSKQKADAVALMDGSRSQVGIRKDCGIDDGNLSRLVRALREADLIGSDDKHPRLLFPIPPNFADMVGRDK